MAHRQSAPAEFSARDRFTYKEWADGSDMVFLLTLTWAGRTFRLSRVDSEVPYVDQNNQVYYHQYEGVIEEPTTFESALSLFASTADDISFSFTARLPGVSVSQPCIHFSSSSGRYSPGTPVTPLPVSGGVRSAAGEVRSR